MSAEEEIARVELLLSNGRTFEIEESVRILNELRSVISSRPNPNLLSSLMRLRTLAETRHCFYRGLLQLSESGTSSYTPSGSASVQEPEQLVVVEG